MGTGKGAVELWVASVAAGRVLYEMRGVDEVTAREAFRLAATKLPLPTRFLKRNEVVA
jgi:large subunit ribosomal protein L16